MKVLQHWKRKAKQTATCPQLRVRRSQAGLAAPLEKDQPHFTRYYGMRPVAQGNVTVPVWLARLQPLTLSTPLIPSNTQSSEHFLNGLESVFQAWLLRVRSPTESTCCAGSCVPAMLFQSVNIRLLLLPLPLCLLFIRARSWVTCLWNAMHCELAASLLLSFLYQLMCLAYHLCGSRDLIKFILDKSVSWVVPWLPSMLCGTSHLVASLARHQG